MNIPKPLIATFFIIAAIVIGYFVFRSSEEDKIRQRLDELAEIVSTPVSEGLLGKAKIISTFEDLFANPVVIETEYRRAQGVHTPKELAATYLALSQSGHTLTLSFKSPSISFPSEQTAQVESTTTVSLTRNGQEENRDSRKIRITLQKDNDDTWKFERFTETP